MKILITILSVTSIAFAQVPTISVSNFNLNYNDPSGAASANHLIAPGYTFENSPSFTVEKQAGNFVLETSNDSLTIEDAPEQIMELEKLKIENLNLETNTSRLSISASKIEGNNLDTDIDVRSLSIDCNYKHLSTDLIDEVLNSCVNNYGKIKLRKFANDGKDVINDADFKFKNNDLDFKIKAAGFNITGDGKAYYTPGLLRIKIEKAKVGILNVKNKLFDELEKVQSQSLRVNKPWIEIDL